MPPYETESSQYFSELGNDLIARLEQKLDEQGRRWLHQLQDTKNGEDSALAYDCFIHGFKVASQIMAEVFVDPDSEVLHKELYHYSKVRPREAPAMKSEIKKYMEKGLP